MLPVMSCRNQQGEAGKLQVLLTFRRDDLLYDIKNYAFIEGSIMQTESAHNRHTVQDVGEEGNVDRVLRVLDLCVARCTEKLYPYTKREVRAPYLDNRLRRPLEYVIMLAVPAGMSQTTMLFLEKLIHEYLVCECVADWMSITNPDKMSIWRSKSEGLLEEIRSNLQSRRGGIRRRMHPF